MARSARARAAPLRLRSVALALALGLATAFLVAWTAAYIDRDNVSRQHSGFVRGERWIWTAFLYPARGRFATVALPTSAYADLPFEERWSQLDSGTSKVLVEHGRQVPPAVIAAIEREMTEHEVVGGGFSAEIQGWPFRMLFMWEVYSGQPIETRLRTVSGVTLSIPLDTPPLQAKLALRPLWPGLLANVALYAALWAALLILPRWLRRDLRRRRGRCARCGYNLAGLPPATTACPECAHPRPLPRPSGRGADA